MPTAAAYPDEYTGDTQAGANAPMLGWREFFADPRLEALVATALEHNRDLASAVARIEESRGLYGIQRADQLPSVNANADATRARASQAPHRCG